MKPGLGGAQAGLQGSRQLRDRKAALVLVAVEKRGRASGRSRMAVIPDFKRVTLNSCFKQNMAPGTTVYTDRLKSFSGLQDAGFKHVARIQPLRTDMRKDVKSVVPLADRAIGNLQQWLIGTHHDVSRDHLQVYLDEFVFCYNRRKQPMAAFQTLLVPPLPMSAYREERISHTCLAKVDPTIWWSAETTG